MGASPVRSPLLRASPPTAIAGRSAVRGLATPLLIPLPRGTEMFQFPRCPPDPTFDLVSSHHGRGVAPFGFGGLIARLQLPHHVSPRSASFFGSWPLGIHPAPSPAWRFSSPRWLLCSQIIVRHALRTRALLASANMRKTFDNISYSSRAPHSATASRANILRWLSLPYHNMRLFRCSAPQFPSLSGGDETCLREPETARERHPLSITRLQGSVNPSCHIFSGKPLPGATGQTAPAILSRSAQSEKRKRTSAHIAAKPSRQVIFLPSA